MLNESTIFPCFEFSGSKFFPILSITELIVPLFERKSSLSEVLHSIGSTSGSLSKSLEA